jgi:Flp pilus assembly protein TadG
MTVRCKQLAVGTEASEIVEAALVLPIVFMLLFGIIWFGRAFNIYTTITYAANQGAQVSAQPSCATCGNDFNNATTVYNRVAQVLQASHIDPRQIRTYSSGATLISCTGGPVTHNTANNVQVWTNVELNTTTQRRGRRGGTTTTVVGPSACGTIVSFEYPYQFTFPFTSLNKQLVLLKADVQMQTED